jgi:signal transduction histidine kinase
MTARSLPIESLVGVEAAVAKRAAIASAFQIVGYAWFRWFLAETPPVPRGTDIAGVTIVGAMLARTALWFVRPRMYAQGRRLLWLVLFRFAFWLGGAGWGVLGALCFMTYGLTYPTFVSILLNVGITAGSSPVQLGSDRFLVFGFIPLTIGPAIVVTLVHWQEPGYLVLGVLLVLFVGYMFAVAGNSRRLIFDALHSRHLAQMQKEQLAALIDAMPGYVMWTDLDGRVLGMNERLAGALHETRVFADVIRDFVASNNRLDVIERVVTTPERAHTHVLAMLRRDTADGEQIILSALDVEAQKIAERQVQTAMAQAQESSRLASLGTVAVGIAHEINNPLQVMRNLAELVRMQLGPSDTSQQQLLDRMDRMIGRMATIVAGMRSLAREAPAAAEPVKLKGVVDEVVEIVRSSRPTDDARILIGPIDNELLVECRESEIGQVLLNLLVNAQDAIRNLDDRWIRLDVADNGDSVELSVTDSGTGIPRELVDKIMLPFFTTKTGTSTGLGLGISRSIVERHGGTLVVDTAHPHTRFVTRLPKRAQARPS